MSEVCGCSDVCVSLVRFSGCIDQASLFPARALNARSRAWAPRRISGRSGFPLRPGMESLRQGETPKAPSSTFSGSIYFRHQANEPSSPSPCFPAEASQAGPPVVGCAALGHRRSPWMVQTDHRPGSGCKGQETPPTCDGSPWGRGESGLAMQRLIHSRWTNYGRSVTCGVVGRVCF